MKNSTSLIYLGMTLGLLVSYLSKTPITIETVFFFGVLSLMTMEGKFFDFIRILILSSLILLYIGTWSLGKFNWYEPIFVLWIVCAFYYTLFIKEKKNKTVFVHEGDVISFPPVLVPDYISPVDETIDCNDIVKSIIGNYDSKTGGYRK